MTNRQCHSMRSISIASRDGSRRVKFALSTTEIGSSRNTAVKGLEIRSWMPICGYSTMLKGETRMKKTFANFHKSR